VTYGVKFNLLPQEVYVSHIAHMEQESTQVPMIKLFVTCGESFKTSKERALEHQYHKEVEVVVNVLLHTMSSLILIFGAKFNHWIKTQAAVRLLQ
jgi:hypothetical protein